MEQRRWPNGPPPDAGERQRRGEHAESNEQSSGSPVWGDRQRGQDQGIGNLEGRGEDSYQGSEGFQVAIQGEQEEVAMAPPSIVPITVGEDSESAAAMIAGEHWASQNIVKQASGVDYSRILSAE